ncbi:AAA domain-containing protein [Rhodococcus pyridinivorans]|uniref:AAA domain-containing protein n=1 Tax=Rhodococcus pyridinivorans TaxID=103816 RepID=UPI0021645D3A|nr:AAA domain-containing protein [Rhodococcus pyridinivorans]UVT26251.1 AAA domain-containing protein [Rhodococcus pyridinivorans]
MVLVTGLHHSMGHYSRKHRDIKPGNILIDDSGAPLLADFGIAKIRGDEPHSELTVQHYRSGVYAPPELESHLPYVRDVYSVGVVLLQCLTSSSIKDFPDVQRALDSVNVRPDVRKIIEACVSPEPTERPVNASALADEFSRIERERVARYEKPRNVLWLKLTQAAQKHLVGEPVDHSLAAAKLQKDLSGEVFVRYGTDSSGRRDRNMLLLFGSEHRYTLKPEKDEPKFVVTAAPTPELEDLEGGRRRSLALPPIFTWTVRQPLNTHLSERARDHLVELLDDYYERQDDPASEPGTQGGDELFDLWLRVLDAREELTRGKQRSMPYKSVHVDGRRGKFVLTEPQEADLIGTDWQVVDQQSERRFAYGEVIDQSGVELTLLSSRPLTSLPKSATLVPYDAPSAISLSRQRNAVTAVRNGATPGPDLRSVLLDPSSSSTPEAEIVHSWSAELDTLKKRAVQLALGANDILVVQGPPGTGKTRFIAETVIQTLRKWPRARILIASQTHVAVDNAVERLHNAGVRGLVRLAGANESVVQPEVRDLLLDKQIRRWAEGVRSRAESHIARRANALGLETHHLRAAMVLGQLAAVSLSLEMMQQHVADLSAAKSASSELLTVVENGDPFDRYQAKLDQLSERRQALAEQAQAHLVGDLTISTEIGSIEARHAIDALVGDSPHALELLKLWELQANWLERIEVEEDSLASIFLAGTSVLAGTCTGFLRNKAVGQLEFDLCIVDEASKATLTEALVPMSRAKRWVLVGDTRQLPPTDEELLRDTKVLNEYGLSADDVTETLFQRLVDHLPEHSQLMLEEQYRMIRPIGDLISTCFYEGRLRSPRTEGLKGYAKVMGGAVTWIDTALRTDRREQGTTSFVNRAEAKLLVTQLDTIDRAINIGFIDTEDRQLEVLVIAPYKSQVEELRRRLAPKRFSHLSISVMSVDAVQGREADLAFVSLTRSNSQGRLGFLGADYWRRINVALSRARFGLTIIGDAEFIRGTHGSLRNVLEYIEQHPADCEVRQAGRD